MAPTFLQRRDGGVTLSVRVTPKSSRSQIAGVVGDELKVTLNAPPADGRANKELVKLLAKTFSIPKSNVQILSGETSRSKIILLQGATMEKVQPILETIFN